MVINDRDISIQATDAALSLRALVNEQEKT